MRFKFNWGFGIILTFIIFFAVLAFMAVVSFNNPSDLITKNYYEQGVKYQEQIDMMKNTNELKEKPYVSKENDNIKIKFFQLSGLNDISGNVKFYNPSDARRDLQFELKLDNNGVMMIPSDKLSGGVWKVQLKWVMNNIPYYDEQTITF